MELKPLNNKQAGRYDEVLIVPFMELKLSKPCFCNIGDSVLIVPFMELKQ